MNKQLFLIATITLLFVKGSQGQVTGAFTDARDGKIYKTVKIGHQIWMSENLAYKADSSWAYDNKPENVKVYGYLYNWGAAKKACPAGWHVATDAEWTTLSLHLGGFEAAIQLKEKGSVHWSNNYKSTNETGFYALPGGVYNAAAKTFGGAGEIGAWWCSNGQDNPEFAWFAFMSSKGDIVGTDGSHKDVCLSVRCIKDK